MINIAINGAAGRMGQRLIALATIDRESSLVAALESSQHPKLGQDAGLIAGVGKLDLPLCSTLNVPADVVVDFSTPEGAKLIVETCREKKIPLVLATTGIDERQIEKLRTAAAEIPLLWAPSMSLAVNLTMKLAEIAAKALKNKDADVEIIERHHRFKEDAPSGTALKFGQIIADAMGQTIHRHGREGRPGQRPRSEICYHALRVGDNPGEHTVVFAMLGETIELSVRASNRDCYAVGALAAAKFLVGKPPRLYDMNDLLGL
ncbi:MAG: 4-hydroxy-tetrahydrodipicolinate reductase [Thermoguttaceae bacterium]